MSFADVLDVLYEDNHLLGLNKPAGWPTTHFDGTEETVDRLAKSYLKEKHAKPGNVYLGVVHRQGPAGRARLARTQTPHRPQAPTPGPARRTGLAGVRRPEVRLAAHARPRRRPARPATDGAAPDQARPGHPDGRIAQGVEGA